MKLWPLGDNESFLPGWPVFQHLSSDRRLLMCSYLQVQELSAGSGETLWLATQYTRCAEFRLPADEGCALVSYEMGCIQAPNDESA